MRNRQIAAVAVILLLLLVITGNAWGASGTYTGTGQADFMWCTDIGCLYRNDAWISNASSTWTRGNLDYGTVTLSEGFGCYNPDRPWSPAVGATQVNYYNNSSKSTQLFSAVLTPSTRSAICSSTYPTPFYGSTSTANTFSSGPYVAPLSTYAGDGSITPQFQSDEWSTAAGPLW